jgi:hypothetical protein
MVPSLCFGPYPANGKGWATQLPSHRTATDHWQAARQKTKRKTKRCQGKQKGVRNVSGTFFGSSLGCWENKKEGGVTSFFARMLGNDQDKMYR